LGKRSPNFFAHAHILLAQALKLPVVEVILTSTLHQPLVPFPARIACLARESLALDLVPVFAHCPEL
jgi:hypothetical protein